MKTFSFPNHRQKAKYPESSTRLVLGGGYVFASEPVAPDHRTFTLIFPKGYKYFLNGDGTLDITTNADKNNFGAIEIFYQEHKLHLPFTYPHPIWGPLKVRFNKPLETPDGVPNGDGAVENFELEIIETD